MTKLIKKSVLMRKYNDLINSVGFLLEKTRREAYSQINQILVKTYWEIGERIAREEFKRKERADYGKKLINRLSEDLEFDKRLLYRMLQFYKLYPILPQVATELSWSHYFELLRTNKND